MGRRGRRDRFPLWWHKGTGLWCKKHKGEFHYFGPDKETAHKRYLAEWPAILAGRAPPRRSGELTVAGLANEFLTLKRQPVDAGELTARSWSEYHATCETVVDQFGRDRPVRELQSEDFADLKAAASGRLGHVALGNFIQRVRTLFKFGFDAGLMEVPVKYGPGFDKPSRRVVRLERARHGARLIDAAAVNKVLDLAEPQLKAMILLGVNCGFGQGDCSELPRSALETRPGWLDFPRPKTGIGRRAPLWEETTAALAEVAKLRPAPKDPHDDRLVFLTRFGRPWVRFTDRGDAKRGSRTDAVGLEFAKLTKRAGVKVPGGFYVLRRIFRTVADAARDPVAAGLVMGHHDPSMAGYYRELVSDARLKAVVEHVRAWLLAGRDCPRGLPATTDGPGSRL
jgi:integrase